MLPLAMLGPVEIAVVAAVGFLLYKLVNRKSSGASGVIAKTLGVAAVVAGIGVLVAKNDNHVDESVIFVEEDIAEIQQMPREFVNGDFLHGEPFDPAEHVGRPGTIIHARPHYAMLGLLTLLGSGLIILGAILIGREKTRPLALKAVTWVGIGAILFSVVNFFSDAPRVGHDVRNVARQDFDHHEPRAKRPSRPGRAKRPALRPERPADSRAADHGTIELPPRAGEIPVEVELAKVEVAVPAEVEKSAPAPAIEAEKPAADPPAEEKPAAAEQPAAKTDEAAKASSEAAEEEADAAAAETKPDEPSKPDAAEKSAPQQPEPEPVEAAPKAASAETVAAAVPASPAPTAVIAMNTNAGVAGTVRPVWVDAPAALVGDVYTLVVSSGPYVSVPECQRALDEAVLAAANHYINEYLGDDKAASLVNISPAYLRRKVKTAEYAEVLQTQSVGAMHQLHARLEFDEQARADIQQSWRSAVVKDRLWYTGGGAALVLALLATFYGYLKLDLKADVAHKGQLQLAATLVALIVAAGALLARWAVPF